MLRRNCFDSMVAASFNILSASGVRRGMGDWGVGLDYFIFYRAKHSSSHQLSQTDTLESIFPGVP